MKAREWRELMGRYEQSGLTIRAFCEAQGISAAAFYQWRRRLEGEAQGRVMKFAVIEPLEDQRGGVIELRLATGEALVIHGGAEAALLKMVLSVLREQTR